MASPTSAFPEGEFKALNSLTKNSSDVSYRHESSCPNNISACVHLFMDIRDANPSAEASITFPLTVSSTFSVTCTENFIPVFSCWCLGCCLKWMLKNSPKSQNPTKNTGFCCFQNPLTLWSALQNTGCKHRACVPTGNASSGRVPASL